MHFFKRLSIKYQFYFIASILFITCIMLVGLVNHTVKNLLLEQQLTYAKSTLSKFESEISSIYERVVFIYSFLQFDSSIENIFIEPFTPKMLTYLNLSEKNFSNLAIMNADLVDISLVGNGIYYSSLFDALTLDKLSKKSSENSQINSLGIMPSSFTGAASQSYCIFAKNIFNFSHSKYYGQQLGTVLIAIDPANSLHLPNSPNNLNTAFMIIDQNLNVYPFNDNHAVNQEDFDIFLQTLSSLDIGLLNTYTEIDTSNYLFSVSYLPNIDYYIVSAIDKEKISSQLQPTRVLMDLVLLIILIFIFLIIMILFHNMMAPLNKLYLFIKSIGEGNHKNLKQPLNLEGSKEITTLSSEFNRMFTEINTLNAQLFKTTTHLYEIELEKNNAEIAHLRSQINPHFLYNTLESMRGMALEQNMTPIADMCFNMGKIFRYSIKGTTIVPLTEEISIVKSYLNIQSARFTERFETLYNIAPDTQQLKVPKMILQPLIENAIFHGLEPKLSAGIIYIGSISLPHDLLKIIIQDDGVGIPQSTLATLQEFLTNTTHSNLDTITHLGILNVHNRIRLLYGEPYGLHIESQESLGTKITILLPKNLS